MALGSTQPLTAIFPGVKAADNLSTFMCSLPQPPEILKACPGLYRIALPLTGTKVKDITLPRNMKIVTSHINGTLGYTVSKTSTLKQSTTLTHQTRLPRFDRWDKTQLVRERRKKEERVM
jgi:hypothetical protein